ncbi:MAG: hypothetical protein BWY72_01143 [Bacteroidetes bacterium ADurb.Bin416]|nr:MAG: hypothetical protein BWY72_01143 [Bacteroidetes bacterium ADurb.Bin416]
MVFPVAGDVDGFPVQGLVGWIIPHQGAGQPFVCDLTRSLRIHAWIAGRPVPWLGTDSLDGFLVLFDALRDVWKVPEARFAHPGLNRGATNAGVDDAHGYAVGIVQFLGKEITDNGEIKHRGRGGDYPLQSGIICQRSGNRRFFGHIELTDFRKISLGDFLGVPFGVTSQVVGHVGLTGTDPYIA